MSQPLIETEAHPTNTFTQWFGMLGGGLARAMQLQANYALVSHACHSGDLRWVHLTSAAFLARSPLTATAVGWSDWRKSKHKSPASGETAEARSSFMGLLGMLINALFALVIIAQWIPVLFFNPCQQ
jgi:hypothetical protein